MLAFLLDPDILGIRDIGIAKQFEILTPRLTGVVALLPFSSHHLSYDDCV